MCSLTLVPNGVNGGLQNPIPYTLGKNLRYPLDRRLHGPQSQYSSQTSVSEIEPRFFNPYPVIVPTELIRFRCSFIAVFLKLSLSVCVSRNIVRNEKYFRSRGKFIHDNPLMS